VSTTPISISPNWIVATGAASRAAAASSTRKALRPAEEAEETEGDGEEERGATMGVGYATTVESRADDTPHIVTADQDGITLSALVRELAPGTSWSRAREICGGGRVRVNGRPATDPARRMAAGERVEVGAPGRGGRASAATDLIVHLDADVAVVRKPAGILTVPFEREDRDTLLSRARVAARRIDAARGKPSSPTLRAVQRLDKETSGLVVFARTVPAQRRLQEQLADHSVERGYLAITHGEVEPGTLDSEIVADRGDGLRGSWGVLRPEWAPAPGSAKHAVTHVKVVEKLRGATLVACRLETGRQHQIRIHLAEDGHPLVGETLYIREHTGPRIPAPRPMLHAAVLGFVHPRTGELLRFEEPSPDDFATVLERLRSRG
jgi:23S rRNA pseudouridine1911/1915/1917 synthase